MVSTMPTSLVYWSLGWTQATPYLFAAVNTVFIPVAVQQPPTLAQRCQILHNRVQSCFFICKRRRNNWSVEGNLTTGRVKIWHCNYNSFNPNGSKDTISSLHIKRGIQWLHHSPSPAHRVLEIQVSLTQVRQILRKASGWAWVTTPPPARSPCLLPTGTFKEVPIGQRQCPAVWIQFVRYKIVLYRTKTFQNPENSHSKWWEYTTFLYLILSSFFIKDAQEPQLIFKTRTSDKPWHKARNSLKEVTNSTMLDRRDILRAHIPDFCSN